MMAGLPAKEQIDQRKTLEMINQDLQTFRIKALQHAKEKASQSSTSARAVRDPPMVMPSDSETTYDFPGCVAILEKPVSLKDLSVDELEKVLFTISMGMKVGLKHDEVPGSVRLSVHQMMSLLKILHSESAMYTAMVRSGLAAMTCGQQLRMGTFPEEMGLGFLDAAIELVKQDPTKLEGLQALSVFVGEGGPVYINRFYESGALEPLVANFVSTDYTLDELLRPIDLNLPGWSVRLFGNVVEPDFVWRAAYSSGRDVSQALTAGAKRQAVETLVKGGAVRKTLSVIAQMIACAAAVPRDARLVDFCKMLGNLTTFLGNTSNEQDMVLDDLRSFPDFAASLAWLMTHWDYDLQSGHSALTIALRLATSTKLEDRALASDLTRREGLLELAAVARFVDYDPRFAVTHGPTGPQEIPLLPAMFITLLSLEAFPPGTLPSAVVSTLARLSSGDQAPGTVSSLAANLLRRFTAAGLVSPEDLVPGSVVHRFVHIQGGVQMPCDQCGALKAPTDLKRCSRCKSARYCSSDCQRADWKEHKRICLP